LSFLGLHKAGKSDILNLMPFFSIIIPTYNRLHKLPKTIDSVLKQRFSDFEVIISDDGSADGTAEWIRQQKDARIKYLYHDNAGVCSARNKGANIARGHYLIFLDSDDRVTENWLLDFKQEIDVTNSKVLFCNRVINGKATNGKGYQGFLAGTFAIHSDLFKHIGGYDEALKFGENTELRWRIEQNGENILFFNKPNVIYDISPSGGGTNRKNRILFFYYVEKKHFARLKKNKREKQILCQVAAVDCFRLGNRSEGLKLLWKGYLLYPLNFLPFLRFVYYYLKRH
jgi:glycosyltransferase involved in cell wall biosynthesis